MDPHHGSAPEGGRASAIGAWLGALAAAAVLYLCLAARLSGDEAIIGLAVAALAATASQIVRRARLVRLGAGARWLVEAWRLPRYAVIDTAAIFAVLSRQLFAGRPAPSLLLEVPFAAEDGADAATRRALAIAYTTMTPSSIVLGFDDARRVMIFHQIERSPVPEMTRRLGAAP